MKRQVGTIDVTPTWAEITEVYLRILEDGSAGHKAKDAARAEMRRMATLADAFIARIKGRADD